jgi:hypothetical protein
LNIARRAESELIENKKGLVKYSTKNT